ncbi:MAG TPA: HlyD family efflux transporter periplasmic adaptor subunit [Longilinea sp.]|nr:HlyD family efflux transporter periplasmic adaptor subunit [Longilinea sp.]
MKTRLFVVLLLGCLLAACGVAGTPTPLPTVVLKDANPTVVATSAVTSGSVTASGIVVPDQEAQLAFLVAGNVKAVNVAVGDLVKAGQVLVQLDDTAQQLQYDQASQALDNLTSPAALAIAQQTVAQDQQNLYNAQISLNNLIYAHNNTDAIANSQANLVLAQDALNQAQKAYDGVSGNPETNVNKANAYQVLYQAKVAFNNAQANYNAWIGKSNQWQVDLKTATVALDKAKLAEDQALLAALQDGSASGVTTGAGNTALIQARLALQTAQYNLDATRLVAPFAGGISAMNAAVGSYVSPGAVMVVISNTNQLHVETTDLSERDVPNVAVGQTATVTVKALNQDITGKVTGIAPLADTLGGDQVYKVTIDLDSVPANLLAGMSVVVQIDTTTP